MTFDVEMLNCLPIDTLSYCCRMLYNGVVSLTSSVEYNLTLPQSNKFVMPVPRALMDQIRQIIPPLNGKLHKGQSGMSAIYSPHSHPSHTSQAG